MLKKLSFLTWLAFTAITLKAYDGQKIATKIQKVIVFLNGAQVTRTATVNVNAGTSTLTFENLSPGIDVQSIQVHADGEFTILSVKQELSFLNEQVKQKRVEDLQAEKKIIQDKITQQNNMIAVYQEEEAMLGKNQVVSGQNANLDVLKLKQALDFQAERLTELKRKQQTVNDAVAILTRELQKYDRQIADINKGSSTATSNILVTVSSKAALQSVFTLSYVVHNANWYPTYDIRAKDVNSPVSISYKANVSQQTGEDWKNIKLTLSTGNPTVSGSKPELSPYYLNLGMVYSNQFYKITQVSGRVVAREDGQPLPGVSINVKGTSIGTQTNMNGEYSLQVPAGNPTLMFRFIGYEAQEKVVSSSVINVALNTATNQLGEVVVTGYGTQRKMDMVAGVQVVPDREVRIRGISSLPVEVNQTVNQTNVEFNIDNPYSVPSDGKQYTVEINKLDLNAGYEYAVAPKLSTDVFLTAKLTDWNKYNFLSGEANLFFEGTFIGKSLLNTDATADTLNISLGTDKNIVVTRTSLKDLTEKQSIGSNKKETRNWQIEVKNRKSQPVNLLVEDQVPVSQNSSIDVETQELSGGKHDPTTGKVSWNLRLNPQDDKKIQLKYQVKYPKNQSVIVQ
ncbi:MAG TPA: DUF4139 domain-containing protein [Mucilaginibacter sp.]|jgi:hypothetical protein|nr:DUF4139 domain-containing protein [Mucilaginibacter sp.]